MDADGVKRWLGGAGTEQPSGGHRYSIPSWPCLCPPSGFRGERTAGPHRGQAEHVHRDPLLDGPEVIACDENPDATYVTGNAGREAARVGSEMEILGA